MKKFIVRIVAVLFLLVIAAILAGVFFLDPIVKKGIETVGPSITKVPVTLDGVHISLLGASGKVKGLVVGNPEGYKTPNAISIGVAALSLKIGSILSDKVVIKSIEMREPEITLEGSLNGNNLSKILDNLSGPPSTTPQGTNQPPTSSAAAKKLQVDDFLITGAKLHIAITGVAGPLTVPIPEIHLKNLGAGPDGITPAELLKQVLTPLLAEAVKVATDELRKAGKELIQKEGGKVLNNATDKLNEGLGNLLKKK